MINKLLTISGIFIATLLTAQNHPDSLFYKRMEGTIGKKVFVTTHLVRVKDNVTGNYYYTFSGQDGTKQYGKTIELSGKMVNDTSVFLKEVGEDDFSFEGTLIDDRFTGKWHDADDEEKTLPFEMKSYYPKGSLPFSIHYLKSDYILDEKAENSPYADIELVLAWPSVKYFLPEIIDSVKQNILKSFFGENFTINLPDTMLASFEKEYYRNFDKQAGELYKKYNKIFNWEKMISMSVIFNSNYLLTLEYLRYAYSGGSHGITNTSYDVINLRDGSLLKYETVFKDNIDDTLSLLLTKRLKKDYRLNDTVSLKKAGFFYDTVKPNRNIFVNGNGIGFVYNNYEIAPSSQGIITVFLPFAQIKNLIRKGTPVYPLSHKE